MVAAHHKSAGEVWRALIQLVTAASEFNLPFIPPPLWELFPLFPLFPLFLIVRFGFFSDVSSGWLEAGSNFELFDRLSCELAKVSEPHLKPIDFTTFFGVDWYLNGFNKAKTKMATFKCRLSNWDAKISFKIITTGPTGEERKINTKMITNFNEHTSR